MIRIGSGYDVHRFISGRKLIVGGVDIPFELGLDGHSDADVLLHAICDALLGAAALGDIGMHFPDTNTRYKGIDSLLLLKHTANLINESGYKIVNIDSTVIAQKPKMMPHINAMRENIAKAIGIDVKFVSVKATTEEGLGFTGAMQGVSAQCVCLIETV